MPELPDVTVYIERLEATVVGRELSGIELLNPFVLRSVQPAIQDVVPRKVEAARRIGKRIVLQLEAERFVVIHLMIAGRLRWRAPGAKVPRKLTVAVFELDNGRLLLTEAGTQRRASIHLVEGEAGLEAFERGGVELLSPTVALADFRDALTRENHTLKRTLTDPRVFSGIGNAYSDEILHRAGLSPVKQTQRMDDDEIARLHAATIETLEEWTRRLRDEVGDGFPEKVTAFHDEMAVHGRFGKPCPVCGTKVQRIVYASNETNYCARCQTGGKLLADRSLSRLLKKDWPKRIEDIEG